MRPVGTTLLAIGLFLAGVVAYSFLPVSSMPTIEFPTIRVSASRPGADPAVMAATLAAPLERRLGEIPGVIELTSSSSLGNTSITVQFDLNRNIDGAARDVQAALNAALTDLPGDLPTLPDHAQGQSVGVADPDPGADLQDPAGERDVRHRRHRHRAAHLAGRRRRRGHRQRRRAAGDPHPGQSGRRRLDGREPGGRAARRRQRQFADPDRLVRRPRLRPHHRHQRAASHPARLRGHRGENRQRHGRPPGRHRHDRGGRAQPPLGGLVQRCSRRCCWSSPSRPTPTSSTPWTASTSCCRS